MELRYYQRAAINAVAEHLQKYGTNPCIEIPTGGGKSPVIAELTRELVEEGNRVLILAHRKELLEQNADKIKKWAPEIQYGIYSAGLGKRELTQPVIVAGIQSIYKRGIKISAFGNIDFVIVDEAHLIPPSQDEEGGMYRTLIDDLTGCNPNLTVIGLTATPYRLGFGRVCGPNNVLNKICYTVSVKELIAKGFLSPLVSKGGKYEADFSGLKLSHGEFIPAEVDERINTPAIVKSTVGEIVTLTQNRRSVLVFCSSVRHARCVADELARHVDKNNVALITGETQPKKREEYLARFRGDKMPTLFDPDATLPTLKYLVNVDVLTTGFDAPNIDCVVLLRPTNSPGLYSQMVGRGLRLSPGKTECLILDFGGNIKRHGPIDDITIDKKRGEREKPKVKKCPRCFNLLPLNEKLCCCGYTFEEEKKNECLCPACEAANSPGNLFCGQCGYKFPVVVKHSDHPEDILSILSDDTPAEWEEDVKKTEVFIHSSKTEPGKQFLRISYLTTSENTVSEFANFDEDTGTWKREQAVKWWAKRSKYRPFPTDSATAADLIELGYCATATRVKYRPARRKGDYPKLLDVMLSAIPDIQNAIDPTANHCRDCGYYSDNYCTLNQSDKNSFDPSCETFIAKEDLPF